MAPDIKKPDPYAVDIAGLDALDVPVAPAPSRLRVAWGRLWPVLAAIALGLFAWQVIVWLELKPSYALPGPMDTFKELWADKSKIVDATGTTMRRIAVGYGLAVLLGSVIGLIVARVRVVRAAIGSLLTGLQTMPTIAWFPLTILLFGASELAIQVVIVLGAAPAIANGLVSGVDHIPPLLLRAGRILGARGVSAYRHVIIPAALPGFISGLKQGWAFAWRSLMAGELIVIIADKPSLGVLLDQSRQINNAPGLMAAMIVILIIGIVVDSLLFARAERGIRERWGLLAD